jgi:tetratricopeptide (TPR) repeat protein
VISHWKKYHCVILEVLDTALKISLNTNGNTVLKSSQLQERGKELQVIELASDLVQELWHVPLTIEFVGKGHRSEQKLMAVLAVLKNTTKREEFIAAYQQEDEPLGYDQKTADGTTTFITLYMIGSVSQAAQQLWSVMAFLDPSWYAESLFQMIHSAADVPLGHIVSNREALSEYFGELYALGFISSTQDKDGYWTHDQLQLVARVSLRKTAGKQIEYASIAASWVSKAFPNYNTFQKKWVHNKEYLTHALTCIGYCEQLRIQTPDLQKLYYKSSNYARFIGNYPTAESLGKRATETFDPSTGDRHDYFRARESFALALRRVSKFDEAIAILRESLKQQEQDLEQDDPDTLSMLNELGWAIFLKGGVEDAKEAEPILREAMIRREKRLGPEAGATQHTYQNLATCLAKLERYKEAESLYKLAFEGHVKLFGTEDQHWVQHIKGNIAKMYEAQGKLEKAMDLFRGVMEWREKNVNFGLKHPDTLRVALSLARVYHKLGRHNDAMELARKTRSSYAKTFGEDHAETKGIDAWIEEIRLRRNGHDNEMSGA